MVPNLFEATNNYWQKLNQLEIAYRRGEVSLEEVDTKVEALIAELGRERRATLRFLWYGMQQTWSQQKELILSASILLGLLYIWLARLAV
ncbi:hypothetical protein [Pantanalinema sp. GBBB05]|uniref:hypothetical protein n=1 Tax=Pantanalinema sp. GBBB05 TaxID=2604139 RepID=UPI001D5E0874|nr:hypothetical protein [Pantanalinema sp. GBBB05]